VEGCSKPLCIAALFASVRPTVKRPYTCIFTLPRFLSVRVSHVIVT